MPIIILIHHYSDPNISHDKLLFEELKNGNIYNEHFATICDFQAKFGKGKFKNFGFYHLRQNSSKTTAQQIDQKRNKIGILNSKQIYLLNQIKGITKFWNRLY